MTDIPRGPGGDGSPQLDLDAIEERLAVGGTPSLRESDELVALVRRLQQENDRLHAQLIDCGDKYQARRGRVEELTAALRALPNATEIKLLLIGFNALYEAHRLVNFDTTGDVKLQRQLMESVELSRKVAEKWRALLAKVVPEKETP